jgi:site-specific DNA-methyltransferase (adenine-specific)
VASNLAAFRYEWIYEKTNPKGFLSASRRPLTAHENVAVFCDGAPPYHPQKWTIPEHLRTKRKHATSKTAGECYGGRELKRWNDDGSRFPTSVIGFSNRMPRSGNLHPTQKPIELIEYLIATYTNPGDTVLDNCMGSGTTGVACKNLGRKFIGIELDDNYYQIATKRIKAC